MTRIYIYIYIYLFIYTYNVTQRDGFRKCKEFPSVHPSMVLLFEAIAAFSCGGKAAGAWSKPLIFSSAKAKKKWRQRVQLLMCLIMRTETNLVVHFTWVVKTASLQIVTTSSFTDVSIKDDTEQACTQNYFIGWGGGNGGLTLRLYNIYISFKKITLESHVISITISVTFWRGEKGVECPSKIFFYLRLYIGR